MTLRIISVKQWRKNMNVAFEEFADKHYREYVRCGRLILSEFAEGSVKHYLNTIWHTADEKPRDGVITVMCTDGKAMWMAMSYECGMESTHWAYIEDLIPDNLIVKE